MIGGWIYSKPVGWLVCMFADQSIGIMDGQLMVGLLIGSFVIWFVIWSVGQSVKPAGCFAIQPATD